MKLDDDTLANYLANFVHGFEDSNQRQHLRKRGWIEYVFKSWNMTPAGRDEAISRGLITI